MRKAQDWDQPCPDPDCSLYKIMHQGNVSAISTYMTPSGKRRILRCAQCKMCFSATRDTVFFDLRTSEEKVMMALKMLLVKVDLAGIRFVLGVTEETVLEWLARAAHKAQEIDVHLLRELPVTQVQLDEMWNFIARKHSSESDTRGESPEASADGRRWIWVSFAPEYRLMLATFVGPRTMASAKSLHWCNRRSGQRETMLFQRWIQLLPPGTACLLSYPHHLCPYGQARTPEEPCDGTASGSGLRPANQAEGERTAQDLEHTHPRRCRATPRAWPDDQHSIDRACEPHDAPSARAPGTQDIQLLQRPGANPPTSRLLPGVLQRRPAASEFAYARYKYANTSCQGSSNPSGLTGHLGWRQASLITSGLFGSC